MPIVSEKASQPPPAAYAKRKSTSPEQPEAQRQQLAAEIAAGERVVVPLVVPRFPRRRPPMPRLSLTEDAAARAGGDDDDDEAEEGGRRSGKCGGGPGGATAEFAPSSRVHAHRTEVLTVDYRDATLEEDVRYQTYAMYKHGKHKIVTQAVGYNERGDFLLQRSEEAEVLGTNRARRSAVSVEGAVCLDPKAKTAVSDDEGNVVRMEKKYPGVKCPKNRRVRNRLMNDHFASAAAHPLREAAIAQGGQDLQDEENSVTPVFGPIPVALRHILEIEDDAQDRMMAKFDLGASQVPGVSLATDVNSASWRFSQLPTKLRSEVRHALLSTDFMPTFVKEVEDRCIQLVRSSESTSFALQCRDGYGRLMCHAVSLFYHLISKSSNDGPNGERMTVISVPKRRPQLPHSTLCEYVLGGGGVSPPGSPQIPLANEHDLRTTEQRPRRGGGAQAASAGDDGDDAVPRLRFKLPKVIFFAPLRL